MGKRVVWAATGLVCVVIVGTFAYWLARPGYYIDKLAVEQIKVGMTEDEVMRLVGMPPGDYSTAMEHEERSRFSDYWVRHSGDGSALFKIAVDDPLASMDRPVDLLRRLPGRTGKQWRTNSHMLFVIFDDGGIVTGFYLHGVGRYEDTWFEKLRRWLSF